MKKILFISVLIILFGLNLFAQDPANCPTIDVIGPGGIPFQGEPVSFTANVDTKERTDLQIEYVWTVSSGKIIYGQGTPNITVERDSDESITVTVEIKGFPEGCSNADSETMGCGLRPPQPIKAGEFLNFVTPTEKNQLKDLKNKVLNDSNAQIYVIGRFKENTSEKETAQKLKKLGRFLMKELAVESSRITITRVFGESEFSEIWLVPPGANNPQP